eukprot:c44388_g1_i1 orf=48-227(+)
MISDMGQAGVESPLLKAESVHETTYVQRVSMSYASWNKKNKNQRTSLVVQPWCQRGGRE